MPETYTMLLTNVISIKIKYILVKEIKTEKNGRSVPEKEGKKL